MISRQKATNYAKALFDLGGKIEQINQRQEQLEQIAFCMTKSHELLHLLSYPGVADEAKIAYLEKILGSKLEEQLKNFLLLVFKRRQAAILRQMATEYHKLVVYSLKEIDVEITSADPLPKAVQTELKQKLENRLQKKVNLILAIDSTLLAGFTILIHNQLLDLSIKGQVENLRKQLVKANL